MTMLMMKRKCWFSEAWNSVVTASSEIPHCWHLQIERRKGPTKQLREHSRDENGMKMLLMMWQETKVDEQCPDEIDGTKYKIVSIATADRKSKF